MTPLGGDVITGRRRALTAGAGALVLLGMGVSTMSASASTGTVPGDGTAAAVQALLDRVLGPGDAVVVVQDTVRTSSGVTSTRAYGSGTAASVAVDQVSTAGGTTRSVVQQNDVSGTTTTVATPAGSLVSRSVSVAVDRAHLGSRSLGTIRALVAGAAGITPARGDRLSLVATTFARPAAVAPPAVSPLSLVLPFVPQLLWVLGAVLAVAVLAAAVRGRRRPA